MNNTFRLLAIMVCLLFAVACGESMESETLGGGADGLTEGERDLDDEDTDEVEGDSDGDDSVDADTEDADTETDESDYEPCAGLQCGASCSVCPPDDADCYETTVLKYCTDDGRCVAGDNPVCSGADEYDPCGGLTCGDYCSLCSPDDPDCVETAVVKYCDADGQCSAQSPRCEVEDDKPYDPCGGLTCGDSCSICPPDDDDCFETAVLKFCDADGQCNAGDPVCEDDDAYDPCEGLSCGDSCSLCAPDDDDCYETMELKYCTDDGFCQGTQPVCSAVDM